jgi:hypothetical protein
MSSPCPINPGLANVPDVRCRAAAVLRAERRLRPGSAPCGSDFVKRELRRVDGRRAVAGTG